MTLATTVAVSTRATYATALDLASVTYAPTLALSTALTNGTGAGQADLYFDDIRTLTASSSENLDLAGGLTNAFGVTLTFVKIRAILITANSGNTNDVVVGAAASNAFVGPFGASTHTVAVPKAGAVLFFNPQGTWTVTAGTGDILKVANGGAGTSVTYTISIIGTSA